MHELVDRAGAAGPSRSVVPPGREPALDPRDVPCRPADPGRRPLRERVRGRARALADRGSAAIGAGHPLFLEYPPPPAEPARYGWGRPSNAGLQRLLAVQRDRYRGTIAQIEGYGRDLARIGQEPDGPGAPSWDQIWFTGVDAAALYSFVRARRPRRFHEIGSGHSTLFAARAVRDGGLATRIVSVDPAPRAEVDSVCDEVLRQPMEQVDPAAVAALGPGDILLVDSSHYALPNSDVVALFLDVIPALEPGVLVGVHDVFLPDDYPWWLSGRGYGEQYLLASWLLGRGERAKVVLPTHYTATDPLTRGELDAAWARAGLGNVLAYGSSFWFET